MKTSLLVHKAKDSDFIHIRVSRVKLEFNTVSCTNIHEDFSSHVSIVFGFGKDEDQRNRNICHEIVLRFLQ